MDYYLGEIRMFSGAYAPEGWQLCDGKLLKITEYEALYAVLGTTYGGDGVTTFAVPDMRGRLMIGQGRGVNLTQRVIGQQGGAESIAMADATTMPVHTHDLNALNTAATTTSPAGAYFASVKNTERLYVNASAPAADIIKTQLAASTISTAGGGAAHNNCMPSVAVSFIIALNGLYPQPS